MKPTSYVICAAPAAALLITIGIMFFCAGNRIKENDSMLISGNPVTITGKAGLTEHNLKLTLIENKHLSTKYDEYFNIALVIDNSITTPQITVPAELEKLVTIKSIGDTTAVCVDMAALPLTETDIRRYDYISIPDTLTLSLPAMPETILANLPDSRLRISGVTSQSLRYNYTLSHHLAFTECNISSLTYIPEQTNIDLHLKLTDSSVNNLSMLMAYGSSFYIYGTASSLIDHAVIDLQTPPADRSDDETSSTTDVVATKESAYFSSMSIEFNDISVGEVTKLCNANISVDSNSPFSGMKIGNTQH